MSGLLGGSSERPLPTPFEWDQGFWDAAKEHRLVVQRCKSCKKVRSFPRLMCPSCRLMEHDWLEVSGKARLYSWSTLYRSFHPAFAKLPITVAIAELVEFPEVHLVSILHMPDGMQECDLQIGQPLEVTFTTASDEITIPEFRVEAMK